MSGTLPLHFNTSDKTSTYFVSHHPFTLHYNHFLPPFFYLIIIRSRVTPFHLELGDTFKTLYDVLWDFWSHKSNFNESTQPLTPLHSYFPLPSRTHRPPSTLSVRKRKDRRPVSSVDDKIFLTSLCLRL